MKKESKKPSCRLSTEPNYVPYKTESSIQNNHLSTQGTTGETKYIQTEKNISPRLIHKERNQKIKKSNAKNTLYDLNCTLKLNLKLIQDFTKSGQLSNLNNQQMNKLQNKIELITKLINNREALKKEKENMNGKKFINEQIFYDSKNRKDENINIIKANYEEYIGFTKKKDITIRKCHKKFNEIQIYIRRESQSFPKYKRIYGNYSIDDFILENENMLRLKEKINNYISQKNQAITVLSKEIKDMKNEKMDTNEKNNNKGNNINIINIKNNNSINSINIINNKNEAINKLNIFLLIGDDKLKNLENKNNSFEQIFNKISYKCYRNYYNNVLKYYDIIDNDFSKSKINENIISGIIPQNNIDNNETYMSNLYFDIMNMGINKSKIEDLSNIFNS